MNLHRKFAVVLVLLSPVAANAGPIYDYLGNTFTSATGEYVGSNVTGFVELNDPIGGQTITSFLDWSFSAGPTTFNPDTNEIITGAFSATLSTDITTFTTWAFIVMLPNADLYIETTSSNSSTIDLVFAWGQGTLGKIQYSPGTWTLRTASVPEPGTLALFGIGLAGMGLARRRKASA